MTFKQPLRADQKELYGELNYGVLIKKPEDSEFYTPATDLDPTASEDNYKESATSEVVVSNNFTQSCLMPKPAVSSNFPA